MPYIITRQAAMDEISRTITHGECLACWILNSNAKYVLHKGKYITVVLSEYPRTWGQTMILLNSHKESVSEIRQEEWSELMENIRKSTIMLEKTLSPLRCYIASLGSPENLPNTCPHVHFNVLPIYNIEDKPADIFTWKDGLYAADEMEWQDLFGKLKQMWFRLSDGSP
jgi:diadenosine tetraphosphate (Ap4A) HIT family hydrolase